MIAALAAIGATDALARFSDDEIPAVRAEVVLAIGGDRADELARAQDPETRLALAEAVANRAAPSPDLLRQLLVDNDDRVRRIAVSAMARAPGVTADHIGPLLDDPNPFVAAAALDALAELRSAAAHARLVSIARASANDAALDAARVGRLGEPISDAHAFVRDALRDRARPPAQRAIRATLAMAGRAGVDLVLESLESSDRERRASAVELIDAQGGDILHPLLPLWEQPVHDAQASNAVLQELVLTDPEELVRDAARRAIDGGNAMETLSTISLIERLLFLRKVGLFASLGPVDLKQVASLAHEELYEGGTTIARRGEIGDRMFIIASGTVRVLGPDGTLVVQRGVGEVVGELSIVADIPRVASLVADGQVRMLAIGRLEFESILRDRPQVAFAIIRVIALRLAGSPRDENFYRRRASGRSRSARGSDTGPRPVGPGTALPDEEPCPHRALSLHLDRSALLALEVVADELVRGIADLDPRRAHRATPSGSRCSSCGRPRCQKRTFADR